MYKTRFEETEIGNNYDMTLLVVRIEERTTKKGDPYCRLTLSDGKTQQEANLFNNNTRESLKLQGVTEEKPVDVRLKCTEFQNQKNYTVDSINPARLTDEEKATLIKMPPLPRQQMLLDMIRIVLDSSGRQYDKDKVRQHRSWHADHEEHRRTHERPHRCGEREGRRHDLHSDRYTR